MDMGGEEQPMQMAMDEMDMQGANQ